MKRLAMIAFVISAVVAAAAGGLLAQSPVAPDVQKLGPQVRTPVPDFTLVDQNGQPRTLRSLTGPKGLMLMFSRSADW